MPGKVIVLRRKTAGAMLDADGRTIPVPAGHLHLVCPAVDRNGVPLPWPRGNPPMEGESEELWLARLAAQAMNDPGQDLTPDNCERVDVAGVEPPLSRRFRACWRWTGARVETDIPLAREQLLSEIRAERNALLKDSDMMRARVEDIGTPQEKAALAAYRQALRDLPATVAADLALIADERGLADYQPRWPAKPE